MKFLIRTGMIFIIFVIIVFSVPVLIVNYDLEIARTVYKSIDNEENIYINLYREKTGKIDKINLEDYLVGVVAAEMPAKFELEALKAQAVASRTYTMSKVLNKKKIHGDADICDTTHCQVYIDESKYDEKFSTKKDEYIGKIKKAVYETRGEVLYYEDQLVKNPLYFAVSSGSTEDASEVFSFAEPYLMPVNSDFDQDAPNAQKTYEFDTKNFIKTINKEYKNADVKSFGDVEILDYTGSGSIEKIRIGNEIIRGLDFRYLFKLNSSNINIFEKDDKVIIETKGYGHGVGLSQWGAGRLAEKDYKYDEILKHYYTGIDIGDIEESLDLI